ncbi:MAG: Gfo/Idh/MocA family oxidoreductase, partial [Bryobacteraceae bacterium]
MRRARLRGALIGCGFFGRIQAEAWRRIPEAEIVAACDRDLARAQQVAP